MRYFLLALLVASFVEARTLSAQNPPPPAEQTMLAPNDSVRVVVWRQPELSGDFLVAPDGSISHPILRQVKVAGVPLRTAENNLRQFLTQFQKNPEFVMEPLLRVSVSGEVPRPLVFATQPETSILQAIARAGGTSREGDRRNVRVIRADRTGVQQILSVDLENPKDEFATSPIHSGDQIIVDRRRNFFKDFFLPAIGVIGAVASVGLLIDRIARHD